MAVVLQPFSQTAFNSLRNLEEAGPRFDELDTKKIIEEEIGPLFREYDVDENFGIQLLHLHAKLEAGEYLTEVRGTSSPIRVGDYPRLRTFATVWKLRFKDGKSFFQPLEYILGSGDDMIDGASPLTDDHLMAFFESRKDFLPKLQGILGKYDLGDLLGLVHHPGVGFPGRVEITSGRSNINLTPMEASKFDPGKTREAAWFFDEEFTKHGCRCLCPDYGKGHRGHSSHVITQSG